MAELDGNIGDTLRSLRVQSSVSLEELSRQTGMSTSAISRVENGQQRLNHGQIAAIIRALDISADELMNWQPSRSERKIVLSASEQNETALDQQMLYVINHYQESKRESFQNHIMGKHVRYHVPDLLHKELSLDNDSFLIAGSVGIGQWLKYREYQFI